MMVPNSLSLPDALRHLAVFPAWVRSSTTLHYTLGGIATLLLGLYLYLWPYRAWTLTFRNLRGPDPDHWFWGNIKYILKSDPIAPHVEWAKKYGPTYRYRLLGGTHRFLTTDPVALSYILSHADLFPKPEQTRQALTDLLGNGVLVAEGADHRRQRKALNPSFSPAAIRGMVPTFFDKAVELKEKLLTLIEDENETGELASPSPALETDKVEGGKKIDVLKWLGKTTLDVIGIAGFSYDFKALTEPNNELANAYNKMFTAGMEVGLFQILQFLVPFLRHIPNERKRSIENSTAVTRTVGKRLVEEKKKAVLASHAEGLEKGQDIGNDLLSILIKANMASDVKPEQRLTDEEVLAQITTFMLAGNETSSTALTWILYTLSQHPDVQTRLREEIMVVDDERPSLETLNSLPLLDAVMRETIRLCPPVPSTLRQATETSVIPLGTPVIGRDGKMIDSVTLAKGTMVFIPILAINESQEIWGSDAETFNPDRFINPDQALTAKYNQIPGVWGNLLSFLGGTRNCIGYRFALAEMKVILFVLMRTFEFSLLNSNPKIQKKSSIVMRPRIIGEEKLGFQMPLIVKPLSG
ncbi:hypothetical protein IAR55_006929 [Kwoniella newhampshirensis]|uniref:Cytochrome P450 n=1 Tax=Kwoniella newhampshirensis TaxID=1651941 RepID=A0AAW0YTL4_9TREE